MAYLALRIYEGTTEDHCTQLYMYQVDKRAFKSPGLGKTTGKYNP